MKYSQIQINDEATLKKARELTMLNAEEGCACPLCQRLVKIYKRPLHAEMARFLIELVKRYQQHPGWYATKDLVSGTKSNSDGVYLVHWGLIEKSDDTNRGKAPCGLYRPTIAGIDFVYMRCRASSHVHLLRYEYVGESDKKIYITEALGKKFDYKTLMSGGVPDGAH